MDSWVFDINEPATMYNNGEASNSPQMVAKQILIRRVVRAETPWVPRALRLERVMG
jgi:hypothetical protein